jgi:hypothetical protein
MGGLNSKNTLQKSIIINWHVVHGGFGLKMPIYKGRGYAQGAIDVRPDDFDVFVGLHMSRRLDSPRVFLYKGKL